MADSNAGKALTTILNTSKVKQALADDDPSPLHVVNLPQVIERYQALSQQFNFAELYYSVKANGAPEILMALNRQGASFEVSGRRELDQLLQSGIPAQKILYSNPAKLDCDIQDAYQKGVRHFVSDAQDDVEALAIHAPRSHVLVRLATSFMAKDDAAHVRFDQRFGLCPKDCLALLQKIIQLGLNAWGICFHVGTHQTNIHCWEKMIALAKKVFDDCQSCGIELQVLDIGGGYPSQNLHNVPAYASYASQILKSLNQSFGHQMPKIMMETGRCVVAEAGVLVSQVVSVKQHPHAQDKQIVITTAGRVTSGLRTAAMGLAAFRQDKHTQLLMPLLSDKLIATDIYGMACTSEDQIFEDLALPAGLKKGDHLVYTGTGAYVKAQEEALCSLYPARLIVIDEAQSLLAASHANQKTGWD